MIEVARDELNAIFDARRVKAPELKGIDMFFAGVVGAVKNRRPVLRKLRAAAARVLALEPEIQNLGSTRFKEEVTIVREAFRRKKLEGPLWDRAFALVREGARRSVGMRPFDVQIMGAMAMCLGNVAEMATGEGKTLTASLAASVWAWAGKPVHVVTVNDYLVARDAEEMRPVYEMLGHTVGHVEHETPAQLRHGMYRRNVVYCTSKELVADFLRDQIQLGQLKNATQSAVGLILNGQTSVPLLVPGLFKAIVDEADSLLVDEAVTPLIISNSPNTQPNVELYQTANELARALHKGPDFTIDAPIRNIELTARGQEKLEKLSNGSGFWKGKRRREELVQQALVARHCYNRDEHYLITSDEKVQIIDEFTGRVMADRSWRHGLHQAIEIKEGVPVTADKENLAHVSFQRFFRYYPQMAGMTGTGWESRAELWQIYRLPIVRIPTNKPCIRVQGPTQMFATEAQKYDAAVESIRAVHAKGGPVLVGTRSVYASEEISRRLAAAGLPHRVLNAAQNAEEANIIVEAGQPGHITVATNMAGRGTDIRLGRGVAELGGLHVVSTEPNVSARIDRQLYGRAARQGDPGHAQLFCSAEDDLLKRHAKMERRLWRVLGPDRLIRMAQGRAERLARFQRKQVLKQDEWMDQSVPF